jgi:hypothetical protein
MNPQVLEIVGVRAKFWAEQTGSERESVIIDAERLAGQSLPQVRDLARFLSVSHNDDGCVDFWPETGGGVMVRNTGTGKVLARYVNGRRAAEEWPPFAAPLPPEQTYEAGMAAGEARAATFPDVRTHSLPAPDGSSREFASGWRTGFANVRNLRACEDGLAAGDESFREQFDYMTAALKRHAEAVQHA